MKKHFDFKLSIVDCIYIVLFFLAIPGIIFLPEEFGYENSWLENIQLIILFTSCFFAIRAKENRKFFNLVLMFLGILLLREVNCGRTIFFPIPGVENAFYSWKDIKYGWLAHPLFGIYIGTTIVYGLWNKFYIDLWNILKNTKLPFWSILFLITGITLSLVAEKCTHNFLFEEFSELLMYISILSIIKRYSQKEYKSA